MFSQLTENTEQANKNQVFEKAFHKQLVVHQNLRKKGEYDFVSLSYDGENPEQITEWVNAYTRLANQKAVEELVSSVEQNIVSRQKVLEDQIKSKRSLAKQRRQDDIDRLEEFDKIARQNLLKQITTLKERTEQQRQDRIVQLEKSLKIAKQLNIVEPTTSLYDAGFPRYMLGNKALEAELQSLKNITSLDSFTYWLRELQEQFKLLEKNSRVEALRQRKNDDPFIIGLRDLNEQVAKLKNIQIDKSKIMAVSYDQLAVVPEHPIKPKRKLIVIISFVLALMLGVFAAFFINFIEKNRA